MAGDRNNTRASHNQAKYLDERWAMMQQWADMTDSMAKRREVPERFGKLARQ